MYTSAIVSLLLLAPIGTLAEHQKTSTDATCGGKKGYTCLNSGEQYLSTTNQYGLTSPSLGIMLLSVR
jgi:hypothetical protein